MLKMTQIFLAGTLFFLTSTACALSYKDVQKDLQSSEGLVAEIHGADKDSGLFVLVVRNKENFFDYLQVPLVANYMLPDFQDINAKLYELNRHDFVRVKGELHGWMEAAQRHILVSSIEVVKKFDGGYGAYPDYKHEVELPTDLAGKTSVIVKVHAVARGGKILMVEYKDTNIPVVVEDVAPVKDLYRGDKIEIQFEIADHPSRPTHLKLKTGPNAVKVLDALVKQHGTPIEHCGELVMFPQSPQVVFNVFAIKRDIGDGLFRTYTLINFEDMDLFKALREKAQAEWDKNTSGITRGRNYYINSEITACAKGSVNMIDPSQANPQIIIEDINHLFFK